MLKITYIYRRMIDSYKCIDSTETFTARSSFVSGGLTYFRLNEFNYKTVETDFILSVENI